MVHPREAHREVCNSLGLEARVDEADVVRGYGSLFWNHRVGIFHYPITALFTDPSLVPADYLLLELVSHPQHYGEGLESKAAA
jgi:hypothetical protein